jgi:hypothetical protein
MQDLGYLLELDLEFDVEPHPSYLTTAAQTPM